MGIFSFLSGADINAGMEKFSGTEGAVLLDVRTEEEFSEGHIPGSVNVPLHDLGRVAEAVADKGTPLFVYCLSGARSAQAAGALRQMGYGGAVNIGGISGYKGKTER